MAEERDTRGFNFEDGSKPSMPGTPVPSASGLETGIPQAKGADEGLPTKPRTRSPDDSAMSDVWRWSRQYTPGPGRPGRTQGGLSPDSSASAKSLSELEAMYVSPQKVKEIHDNRLTYSVPESPFYFPWKWFWLGTIGLIAATIIVLALLRVDTRELDVEGNPIRKSSLAVIWMKLGGQRMASDDPDIMAYLGTKERLELVYAIALEYERKYASFPASMQKLLDAKMLSTDLAKDGWGQELLPVAIGRKIVSRGADGKADTSDDLFYGSEGLKVPDHYQAYELQKERY
jgi:hypothetical protein